MLKLKKNGRKWIQSMSIIRCIGSWNNLTSAHHQDMWNNQEMGYSITHCFARLLTESPVIVTKNTIDSTNVFNSKMKVGSELRMRWPNT